MRKIKRREFVKQTTLMAAGLSGSNLIGYRLQQEEKNNAITVTIPMPIQIVIDDVGWWSGEDGSARQEPYRTGINRHHVPADYQAIADLGKGLGVRPQAATVLCEWDRNNILRNLPTSTWMGKEWDNSKWVGPWLDEAANIIRSNQRNYELTVHGVGHEYWMDGTFTRAEWADRSGRMRPRDQVELHLDFFARLMDQNRLGAFPKSFVPTAFLHTFGPSEGHETSLAEIVKKRGINYINTPFYSLHNVEAVQYGFFGLDAGVMTVDRGRDLFNWDVIGAMPAGSLKGPTCGLHWPNLLHQDPELNSETVQGWIKFLLPYNNRFETMLAPDSVFFQQQLAHHVCTTTSIQGRFINLDFSKTSSLPDHIAWNQFNIKLRSPSRLRFKAENIKIMSDTHIMDNNQYLYTIRLAAIRKMMPVRIEYTIQE